MSCLLPFSCNKGPRCTNSSSPLMSLRYRDVAGRNLLDPETPNYFKKSDIKSFSFEDGVKTELTDPSEGKAIYYWPPMGNIVIGFLKISPPSTILIQLSPTVTDTIRIIKQGIDKCDGKTIVINKVSYNSNVVFDDVFIGKTESLIFIVTQKP